MIFNICGTEPTLINFAADLALLILIVLGAPIVGGLLSGIDRVFTARLQGRQGPPLLQPFYDLLKLLGKESKLGNRHQIIWMGGYLFLTVFSLIFLFMGQDLLLIVFIMGFAGVCLVMSAFSIKSPYSHMGANRELMQILAYEPVLLLMAVGFYLHNGTFLVSEVMNKTPLLYTMWPIFLAFVLILTIKLRKSPFDFSTSHHAHQEIVKGITTEFSGEYYSLFILAEWYETVLLLAIMTLFWAVPIWVGILIAFAIFLIEIVIDNICARMTTGWMIRYAWVVTLFLCFTNILYLFIKRGGF